MAQRKTKPCRTQTHLSRYLLNLRGAESNLEDCGSNGVSGPITPGLDGLAGKVP